jgi:hypothetical protein
MARDTDHLAGGFETENTGGFLSGLLAEEENFDRRSLLRLGAWGVVSVGAVIVAVMTNQSSIGGRREQVAATDFARQSQQIQSVAKESQSEARRLASAIETLNGDRDRLYSRVTVLEQGLDSATGAIARQNPTPATPQAAAAAATTEPQPAPQSPAAATVSAPAPPPAASPAPPSAAAPVSAPPSAPASASVAAPVSAPVLAPVATTPVAPAEKPVAEAPAREQGSAKVSTAAPTASPPPAPMPATSLVASKSIIGPPDPAAGKLIRPEMPARAITSAPMPEVVASTSDDDAEPDASQASPNVAVQRTEFGVDVGGANSLNGLRALWRGLLKSNSALALLRPVISVKEGRNGLGLQLRLVAGPLSDAAAAAKICAALTESQRSCETTVFDGQRLAMKADEPPAAVKPAPAPRRRGSARHGVVSEEAPQRPENPTLSSLFTRRQ